MKKEIFGEFPEFCYKAYNKEDYAKQFIDRGNFLMGCIHSYKYIEDQSRRDPTEGSGLTEEPGLVTVGLFSQNHTEKPIWTRMHGYQKHHTELSNAKFCFCTCLPDVDLAYVKKQFGRFIVKIKEPRQLAEDIKDYFISSGKKFLRIEGRRVVYNKGQKQERKLTNNERMDLSYKQKPENYRLDCEFRIIAIGEPCQEECKFLSVQFEQVVPDCKFIEVNLNKSLKYAQLICNSIVL